MFGTDIYLLWSPNTILKGMTDDNLAHFENDMFTKIPFSIINLTPLKRVMDTLTEGVIPVFMLHRIEDKERGVDGISPVVIDRFLYELHQHDYEFMGMDELCKYLEKPETVIRNKVLFTMDDGYLDQIEKGVPIFEKYGCPVSIAIITDFISGSIWPWDAKVRYLFETTNAKKLEFVSLEGKKCKFTMGSLAESFIVMRVIREELKRETEGGLSEKIKMLEKQLDVELPQTAPEKYKSLSWEDVKRLEGQGVNFIPHTKSHIILSNLVPQRAREEMEGSIEEIKRHIDPLPLFVYPNGQYGDYNEDHIKVLKNNGIQGAFSTDYSYINLYEFDRNSNERFNIPRVSFPEKMFSQYKVISRLDCVENRYFKKAIRSLFETVYGSKRQVLSGFLDYISHWNYCEKYKYLDVPKIKRIVFLCKGNICRSPFAEVAAKANKIRLPVVSMGYEASGGDKPEPLAIKIAKEFGHDMEALCSTRLDKDSIKEGDLVVVMETRHLNIVKQVVPDVDYQLTLLGIWDVQPRLSIFDPYGRSEARFRYVFAHINSSVKKLMCTLG